MEENAEQIIKKRPSLFDCELEKTVLREFPEDDDSGLVYPLDYIEKVNSEIEQWKKHCTNLLEEQAKFKKKKADLKTTIFDETVLTQEHKDFLKSVSFDNYLKHAEMFCKQLMIAVDLNNYDHTFKAERISNMHINIQNQIESDLWDKHFK